MSNKTILISNNKKGNDSLTNFHQVQTSPYDNFPKQQSTFKRKRRTSNNSNDYEISFNPFISSSSSIFKYVLELKENQDTNDIHTVREDLVAKVNIYNESILKHGIDNTEILVTRYILCTFIDELVNISYLGQSDNWSNNSLLSIFHNETYGGENFFHLLDKFLKTPAKYIHILELMYTCLALGFEGRYRVIDRGEIELNNIKDSLFKQIKIVQGRDPLTFYTNQEPAKDRYRLFNKVSYPILFLSILSLLIIIYTSLTFSLKQQNENFYEVLENKNIQTNQLLEDSIK